MSNMRKLQLVGALPSCVFLGFFCDFFYSKIAGYTLPVQRTTNTDESNTSK